MRLIAVQEAGDMAIMLLYVDIPVGSSGNIVSSSTFSGSAAAASVYVGRHRSQLLFKVFRSTHMRASLFTLSQSSLKCHFLIDILSNYLQSDPEDTRYYVLSFLLNFSCVIVHCQFLITWHLHLYMVAKTMAPRNEAIPNHIAFTREKSLALFCMLN